MTKGQSVNSSEGRAMKSGTEPEQEQEAASARRRHEILSIPEAHVSPPDQLLKDHPLAVKQMKYLLRYNAVKNYPRLKSKVRGFVEKISGAVLRKKSRFDRFGFARSRNGSRSQHACDTLSDPRDQLARR